MFFIKFYIDHILCFYNTKLCPLNKNVGSATVPNDNILTFFKFFENVIVSIVMMKHNRFFMKNKKGLVEKSLSFSAIRSKYFNVFFVDPFLKNNKNPYLIIKNSNLYRSNLSLTLPKQKYTFFFLGNKSQCMLLVAVEQCKLGFCLKLGPRK